MTATATATLEELKSASESLWAESQEISDKWHAAEKRYQAAQAKANPKPSAITVEIEIDGEYVRLARSEDGSIWVQPQGPLRAKAVRGDSERQIVCNLLESMQRSSELAETLLSALAYVADSGVFCDDFGGKDVKRMTTLVSNEIHEITQVCSTYRMLLERGSLESQLAEADDDVAGLANDQGAQS